MTVRGYKEVGMSPLTALLRARHGVIAVAVASFVVFSAPTLGTASTASPVHAVTSRTIRLSDTALLHLVTHQGTQVLHEEGQASGTLRGQLTVTIDLGYTEATVIFSARSPSGTLKGRGVESYYVSGKNGHFVGRMSVTGGTGAYAHASGSKLETVGLIKRGHYEVHMTVNGELKA